MPGPSDRELESIGLDVLLKLGMPAIGNLENVLLRDLDPDGDHSRDDHFEFDFLIPRREVCLVGEITSRGPASVPAKFTKFRRHLKTLANMELDGRKWRMLGVPPRRVRDFDQVRDFVGFFIATAHEEFDERLGGRPLQRIAVFYRPDWKLLKLYSDSIGSFGQAYLESKLGLLQATGRGALRLTRADHSLIVAQNKQIATGGVGFADVYTFELSPYELLPVAEVFRRDLLPDLSPRRDGHYQRPLDSKKLRQIRQKLKVTRDFVFPSNILVTLSSDCRYEVRTKTLIIPSRYGAVQVIDGQHRLFSYADEAVKARRSGDASIMVTAIQFREERAAVLNRYSARTFVEINTNQTRIAASHLDAIAYPVLGETTPQALAAAVMMQLNEHPAARGLFKTSKTTLGVIRPATVAREVRPLVSLDIIKNLDATVDARRIRGLRELLGARPAELTRAPVLVKKATEALAQYCRRLSAVFPYDWPSRDVQRASAFEFAKVFAALFKLFDQFVSEGLTWNEVQSELEGIRRNVQALRGLSSYDAVLFNHDAAIPDSGPTVQDDFKFFQTNRQTPTAINDVITQRRRPRRRAGRRPRPT